MPRNHKKPDLGGKKRMALVGVPICVEGNENNPAKFICPIDGVLDQFILEFPAEGILEVKLTRPSGVFEVISITDPTSAVGFQEVTRGDKIEVSLAGATGEFFISFLYGVEAELFARRN